MYPSTALRRVRDSAPMTATMSIRGGTKLNMSVKSAETRSGGPLPVARPETIGLLTAPSGAGTLTPPVGKCLYRCR